MVHIKYTQLFIDNEWVDAKSGKTFESVNPANKKAIIGIAEGDKEDVNLAVAAAKKAFARKSTWRTMSATDRGALLYKLADKIEEHSEHIATLDSLDMGKPINEARMDIKLSVDMFRYMAGYADKFTGKLLPQKNNAFAPDCPNFGYTKREPIGIIGQIIPWNFPCMMLSWKLAPALAMGNVVVLKPAEQSPLSALFVASLIKEVGFPAGVVNIVPGYGPTAGAAITAHPDIRKVAFTGSTEVGKIIMRAGADTIKRITLELGGKSPLIVYPDADLNIAVATSHGALFGNAGQTCIAASRVFVHESIHDQFVTMAVDMAKSRSLGDPLSDTTVQGPQVDEDQYNKILELIEAGKSEGAKLECGGAAGSSEGYFIEPTIFTNVTDDMRIAREEIFGPVLSIFKFSTMDEVIERANNTEYGLAAAVFSNNVNVIHETVDALEAGSVWVNCYAEIYPFTPFGGFKASGIGREMGESVLNLYTELKTVTITLNPNPPVFSKVAL